MENYRLQKRGRVERMDGRTFPKENVWHKPYGKSSEKPEIFSDKCEQLKKFVLQIKEEQQQYDEVKRIKFRRGRR
jgi:hypothetical protein